MNKLGPAYSNTYDKNNPLTVTDTSLAKSAFNELSVVEVTPIVQYMAVYGFSTDKEVVISDGDGTATIKDRQYNVSTGTGVSSGAAILSARRLTYKPGQGIVLRFTSVFENPLVGTLTTGGLISSTDRIGFGYNVDGEFGIEYSHDGITELQTLTITTGAAGSETANVTIDGIGYSVPLTAGTASHNAYEIAVSLKTQVPLFQFTSNGDTVVVKSDLSKITLSFNFSSATAAGSWVQDSVGTPLISDFIIQADWNGNALLPKFKPSKGNVYQISMQYLGYGAIRFYIEDPKTGAFLLVHTIQYANKNTKPSVINPTFSCGVFAFNVTGTVGVSEVRMASCFGGLEGKAFQTEPSRAIDVEATVTTVNRSVLTLRNRLVFGDIANRAEIKPLILSIGTDANKPIIVEVSKDVIPTGDVIYDYVDVDNSIMEFSPVQNNITNGRLIHSFVITAGGAQTFDLTELRSLVYPNEVITISAQLAAGGSTAAILASMTWQEDF